MTTKKAKKMTLRQQLRVQAAAKLNYIKGDVSDAIDMICKREQIEWTDLMKACGPGISKTAEHNLITQLANKAEVELVKLWNDQQELPLDEEKPDAA